MPESPSTPTATNSSPSSTPTVNLYFASDGHAGLGGLDMYQIRWEERAAAAPENLGYPINSSHDDFGLILDATEERGFFSSIPRPRRRATMNCTACTSIALRQC